MEPACFCFTRPSLLCHKASRLRHLPPRPVKYSHLPTVRLYSVPSTPDRPPRFTLRALGQSIASLFGSSPPYLFESSPRPNPSKSRKKSRKKLPIMAARVVLATVPSADTPGTCIQLQLESSCYVFGRVAEGTQRAVSATGLSLMDTKEVFLTGATEWSSFGGLYGFLLSAQSAMEASRASKIERAERMAETRWARQQQQKRGKAPSERPPLPLVLKPFAVGIHGGFNLGHVLAAARIIILRAPLRMKVHETREDGPATGSDPTTPDFQDDGVRVWKVACRRARSSSPQKRTLKQDSQTQGEEKKLPANGTTSREAAAEVEAQAEVARWVVERAMFCGVAKDQAVLHPRKISELKPDDAAVIWRNNTLKRYRGPYASDGVELSDPDGEAYIFPEPDTEVEDLFNSSHGLIVNHAKLPPTTFSDVSMSYIVKCQDRRGKFLATRAGELGVGPPQFGPLTRGQSVETAHGTVVTPEMVLGETLPGKGFIVADIASLDFVDCFLEKPEWSNAELMENIATMYWILGPGIAEDRRILKFVEDHPGYKHIFCSEDTCPDEITKAGPAEIQVKAHRVDPDRYPLLQFDNTVQSCVLGGPIEGGYARAETKLMPRLLHNTELRIPPPDLLKAAKEMDEEILGMARKAKAKSEDPEFLARLAEENKDLPSPDTTIVTLGTGSSAPSKYRNVSGTLALVPGIGNYLFDCGEGTLGQILRLYKKEDVANILRELKCIAISHLHADHHAGVVAVIQAWYEQALKDGRHDTRLAISCNARFRLFLEEIAQVQDIGFHRLRFPNCPVSPNHEDMLATGDALENGAFGLKSIRRVWVRHCLRSHALQLEMTSGLRIAYSGDCRPSMDFADECHGAHLLIHECTFGNAMASHAKHKKHSTMGEALDVAKRMSAGKVLLTHFSQRYVKAEALRAVSPEMRTEGDKKGEDKAQAGFEGYEAPVLLAYDHMCVKLGEFSRAACYVSALQKLMERSD